MIPFRMMLAAGGLAAALGCGLLWQLWREAEERADAAAAALQARQRAAQAAEAALNVWQEARESTRTQEAERVRTLEQLAGDADRPLADRWRELDRLLNDIAGAGPGGPPGGTAAGGAAAP